MELSPFGKVSCNLKILTHMQLVSLLKLRGCWWTPVHIHALSLARNYRLRHQKQTVTSRIFRLHSHLNISCEPCLLAYMFDVAGMCLVCVCFLLKWLQGKWMWVLNEADRNKACVPLSIPLYPDRNCFPPSYKYTPWNRPASCNMKHRQKWLSRSGIAESLQLHQEAKGPSQMSAVLFYKLGFYFAKMPFLLDYTRTGSRAKKLESGWRLNIIDRWLRGHPSCAEGEGRGWGYQ